MSKTFTAGSEIDSYCTKCKMDLNHRIIAMKDGKPHRVECRTCSGHHNYRTPKTLPDPLAGTPHAAKKRATAKKKAEPKKPAIDELRAMWEQAIVGRTPVGAEVDVDVRRGNREITIPVTVDALPEAVASARGTPPTMTPPQSFLGMQLEPLAPEERLAMGLGDAGVRVIEVTGDPARAAGIRAGDVIVQFAGEPVASPENLEERAQAAPEGRSVPVLIHRDGTPVFIALRIPAS